MVSVRNQRRGRRPDHLQIMTPSPNNQQLETPVPNRCFERTAGRCAPWSRFARPRRSSWAFGTPQGFRCFLPEPQRDRERRAEAVEGLFVVDGAGFDAQAHPVESIGVGTDFERRATAAPSRAKARPRCRAAVVGVVAGGVPSHKHRLPGGPPRGAAPPPGARRRRALRQGRPGPLSTIRESLTTRSGLAYRPGAEPLLRADGAAPETPCHFAALPCASPPLNLGR